MVSYGLRRNAAIVVVLVLVLALDAGRDILLGGSSPGFNGVTTCDPGSRLRPYVDLVLARNLGVVTFLFVQKGFTLHSVCKAETVNLGLNSISALLIGLLA